METLKCIRCKKEVTEEEFKKRYEHLIARGIQPLMIVLCKECREKE